MLTIGVVGGAAFGAVVSTLAGRPTTVGAAAGAAIAASVAVIWSRQNEPWWHDESKVRTFDDVAREDAAFREAHSMEIFAHEAEASALHRLFDGASSARLAEACGALNATPKLASATARFEPWRRAAPAELAAAVEAVVSDLDAPHLLPSGIEKRLNDGVNAASFGLFSLMSHRALDRA